MALTSRASRAVLEANARSVAVEGVAADLVDPVLDLDRLCAGHVPHGVDDVDPIVPERRRHARWCSASMRPTLAACLTAAAGRTIPTASIALSLCTAQNALPKAAARVSLSVPDA